MTALVSIKVQMLSASSMAKPNGAVALDRRELRQIWTYLRSAYVHLRSHKLTLGQRW